MTHPKYTTPTTPENVAERFWSKVRTTDTCWLWLAYRNSRGYGLFCPGQQRNVSAHRFAYELTHGPIPAGMFVCHRCDNPRCVRPDHLFLGTAADNNRDMHEKMRHQFGENHAARLRPETRPRGEAHGMARLAADDVRAIRAERAAGVKGTVLAARYGVSPSAICLIHHRKNWVHIPD